VNQVAGEVFCNRCGHGNPAGANFCSSCGTPLAATPPAPDQTTTAIPFMPQPEPEYDTTLDLGAGSAGAGTLVVKRGPNVGSRFALDADIVQAGRHPDSQIFLDDITVSRRHVEIRREAEGYVVYDVGSLNGTYLNRQRVDRAPLRNGDELQIGTFKLVYVSGSGGPGGGAGGFE
jgi:pSer/pThr/pTyr-binding forkhead associated (FHA) protein